MGRKKIPGYMPGGRPKKAGKNDMMKQIQQMQQQMIKQQEELSEVEVTESAGGGAVQVTVNGDLTVTAVKIDPDVIDEDDIEMLEDMIVAAVNKAITAVSDKKAQAFSGLTGGMGGMPDLSGLF